jgi:molecular chaperone HtpG
VLTEEEKTQIKEIFEKAINNQHMHVQVEAMSPEEQPVIITLPEFMRRMKDMSKLGGGGMSFMGTMPDSYTVSVNANHPIVQHILKAREESREKIARQAFDLGLLAQNMLSGSALTAFVKRSVELIAKE